MKIFDILWDGGGGYIKDDTSKSKELLLSIIMDQYGITKSDLETISIVKSKLRDTKIEEVLK